ncbi:low affinity iron permease family protein [Patescibacteria group bacterium]|nr:low affinity iron permease family protein [Patescibacteria group bacterium]
MNNFFHKLANNIANLAGSPWAFILAVVFILGWVVTGPIFGFSDTWQLIINTVTNIVALLMVFIIQNTQNRDSKAINLKLDELLKGVKGARTGMVDIEDVTDEELTRLEKEFSDMHQKYRDELSRRRAKT